MLVIEAGLPPRWRPFGCQSGPVADCHTPVAGSPTWTAECQIQESDASPFRSYTLTMVWT